MKPTRSMAIIAATAMPLILTPAKAQNAFITYVKHQPGEVVEEACGLHVKQVGRAAFLSTLIIKAPAAWSSATLSSTHFPKPVDYPFVINLPQLPAVANLTVGFRLTDFAQYEGDELTGDLTFDYNGDRWSSADARCKVGGWDKSGDARNREMDCSFACM